MKNLALLSFLFLFIGINAEKTSSISIGKDIEAHDYLGQTISYQLVNKDVSLENIDKDKFKQCTDRIPNIGRTDKACWLKLNLSDVPTNTESFIFIDNPLLNSVDIYIKQENKYIHSRIKENQAFYTREFNSPAYLFKIGNKEEVLIRVCAIEEIIIPIKIISPKKLMDQMAGEHLLIGTFTGIIFIMFFYNLFLYISTREKSYFYYSFYVLFIGLTQSAMRGYNILFMFGDTIQFYSRINIFFACLASVFGILFTQKFLETRHKAIVAHKALTFVIYGFIVTVFVLFIDSGRVSFVLMQLMTLLGIPITLYASYKIAASGFRPALYFSIAWTVLLCGALIHIFAENGLLTFGLLTKNIMLIATTLEVALLSFALADKINTYKEEKEIEQMQKLAALEENKQIILTQNERLEITVEEKTRELVNANKDLTNAMEVLQSAQVSLVESEKMASLGQLTAGVAHEINNPINFVSANVKPLIRDFEDLNDFVTKVLETAEKQDQVSKEQIQDWYKSLDIEFTQNEIGELLNGIKEGANRTTEIVKGLKNFSRLDEAAFKNASLEEGLDSTIILIRSTMKGEIELIRNYGNIPAIDCYAGKLNQAFMNLINNSVYAVLNDPKHEIEKTGKIIVTTIHHSENIEIIIEDNGIGMSQETMNKLFDPFYTTKPVGEGTGLGMSITYSIINDLHKGKLEVKSEQGIGTIIKIMLPKEIKK